jgi:SAM-dependent methyltransferase
VSSTDKSAICLLESPFDAVADTYDDTFTNSLIGRAQRQVVWNELDRVFHAGDRVLELNCGTGVDALRLADRGVNVLACDVAPRMVDVARRRSSKSATSVEFRALASEKILEIRESADFAEFDGALSNFAGLNCVEDLSKVARDLAQLLRPRAQMVLCLFGRFCAWEVLWYLVYGRPGKAFRRLCLKGCTAQPSGSSVAVHVRYHSIRKLVSIFSPEFRLKRWKGVGIAVPPSYIEPLAQKFRGLLNGLISLDCRLCSVPIIRGLADHILLTFERVDDRSSTGCVIYDRPLQS